MSAFSSALEGYSKISAAQKTLAFVAFWGQLPDVKQSLYPLEEGAWRGSLASGAVVWPDLLESSARCHL